MMTDDTHHIGKSAPVPLETHQLFFRVSSCDDR
jgi:hypothetical protein